MGSYYYYLVSQLPYLIFNQTPPMSSEAFKELARPMLSKEDAALLDLISLDPQPPEMGTGEGPSYADSLPSCGSDFIDGWREWERALRLSLAKHRAIRIKREGTSMIEPPVFPVDAVTSAAKAVAAADSPIEGEVLVDRARWSAIEMLQGNDYFGRNTIFAYMLKLLILERRALFQVELGFSEYKSLYASILESVQSGTSPAGEFK